MALRSSIKALLSSIKGLLSSVKGLLRVYSYSHVSQKRYADLRRLITRDRLRRRHLGKPVTATEASKASATGTTPLKLLVYEDLRY